ncbi:hypothetical protein RAS1_08580 [Phycisphaerae bacterium RAS1]|nr:hypothetical protein RAS1_08580 [Phycisphaerae bacterium RAS1]
MEYRCVTTSVEGFVQQLAVAYITHGYWFYVAGDIPENKDPVGVDAKLIDRYGIAITKWARCRRKKQGLANMQYLRHERFFVLLATKGQHEFFERERLSVRDVRRVPIKFTGYCIGCRKGRDGRWHAAVRVETRTYADMRAFVFGAAMLAGDHIFARALRELSFEPYAGVRRQLLTALRKGNRARKIAGRAPLSHEVLQLRRRPTQPFSTQCGAPSAEPEVFELPMWRRETS